MGESASKAFDRVDRLTESQKACLRLVLAHMTSKQIARELTMSPHTVDAHLKASLKTLEVGNRTEAALMLAETEAVSGYQPLAYQPLGMAKPPQSMVFLNYGIDAAADVDYAKLVQTKGEHNRNIVQDGIAGADLPDSSGEEKLNWQLKKQKSGANRKNRLPVVYRLACMLLVSLVSILSFAIIISALQAMSSFYN